MDAQAPRDPDTRKSAPRHLGLTALRLVTIAACLAALPVRRFKIKVVR